MTNSAESTLQHIDNVKKLLSICIKNLIKQAISHDDSKLEDFEKKYFDQYTQKLRNTEYGSSKYYEYLDKINPALVHHYEVNKHHPEHYKNGIKDMNLLYLLEMLCDWYDSSKRSKNGDILKSIEINQKRFGYSDELKTIFINTVEFLQEHE